MKQIMALLACYLLSFTFQAAAEPMRDTSFPESPQLLAFDLNEELNNDAWEILNESSRRGGGGYSLPYQGAVYGNTSKGTIFGNWGQESLASLKKEALYLCTEAVEQCTFISTWEEGCMSIVWSNNKKRFFSTSPTSGVKDKDKAISSALQACKASGASDCQVKGGFGDQAWCTYDGYVEKKLNYLSIWGNSDTGWVWLSEHAETPLDAEKDADKNCQKNYGNCKLVVNLNSNLECIALGWSAQQKRFFHSPVDRRLDDQAAKIAVQRSCVAAGATDCKIPKQEICVSE